jgi:hypothetical protein
MPNKTQLSNELRPPCSRCGKPSLLTLHQHASPGFELRIYYCASCATSYRVIAPIRVAAVQGFPRSRNLRRHQERVGEIVDHSSSKEFAMISESFDSRTLSRMEIALDRACLILPEGSDKHRIRRIIAGKILECANRGDKTLSGLTAAGYAAAIQLSDTQERSRVG